MSADFRLRNEGTISLLWPISDAGTKWLEDHIQDEHLTWGGAVVIEHRFVQDVVEGIQQDGLGFTI